MTRRGSMPHGARARNDGQTTVKKILKVRAKSHDQNRSISWEFRDRPNPPAITVGNEQERHYIDTRADSAHCNRQIPHLQLRAEHLLWTVFVRSPYPRDLQIFFQFTYL